MSDSGVSLAGAYVTRIGSHCETRAEKPITSVELSTALADIYSFFTLQKPLQIGKKVELVSRFHPEPTYAGRQVSPPAMRNQNFGECGGTTGKRSA